MMVRLMRSTIVAALALLSVPATGLRSVHALQLETPDASYVVQIHASRDADSLGFVPDLTSTRSQVMALASGKRFECFVPLTTEALRAQQQQSHDAATAHDDSTDDHMQQQQDDAAFLAFGRAATKKIRPKCIQYVDMADNWVYEVCPGVLVRKVSLHARSIIVDSADSADASDANDASSSSSSSLSAGLIKKQHIKAAVAAQSHEVVELGQFASDHSADALAFSDFVGAETQERVRTTEKPLFTQVYRGSASGDEVHVQFLCSASAVDDTVAGVQWRRPASGSDTSSSSSSNKEPRTVSGFLVLSRGFCDPMFADATEYKRFTVPSLLQPLVDAHTCIKRNEGWWTYEFCFGASIRQYHRDGEGRITAEFSLGAFDTLKNEALDASGGALVREHIDATHDVARPAFLELYDQGSHCKEFDHFTPRRAKVYYYCSQGGASHHILSVKETQTCAYAIKISSPALCDHPHFVSDEQKRDARAEVVHCVPLGDASSDTEVAPASVQLQERVEATTAATTTTTTTGTDTAATVKAEPSE